MAGLSLRMWGELCEDRGCTKVHICSGEVFRSICIVWVASRHEKWYVELATWSKFVDLVIFFGSLGCCENLLQANVGLEQIRPRPRGLKGTRISPWDFGFPEPCRTWWELPPIKKCRHRQGTHGSKWKIGRATNTSGLPRRFKLSSLEQQIDSLLGGVSNIFYFHPYLEKIFNLTSIFFRWVETTNQFLFASKLGVTCCQGFHLQCPDQVGHVQLRQLVKFIFQNFPVK